MTRAEYLELLRDYVSQRFSPVETEDIIRDYEEFFVEGLASGKNEAEVIAGLGSPKTIVQQLVDELQPEQTTTPTAAMIQKMQRGWKKSQQKITKLLQPKAKSKLDGVSRIGFGTRILRFIAQCIGFVMALVAISFIIFIVGNMVWTGLGAIALIIAGVYFLTANISIGMIFISLASICLSFFLIGYVCTRSLWQYVLAYGKRLKTWWQYHVKQVPTGGEGHE